MNGTVFNGGSTSYGAAGNIYGGAMELLDRRRHHRSPPADRPQRHPPAPASTNLDFRVSRDVPIHENIKLQFIGEAFNLVNHRIITGVNSTYSNFVGLTAPTATTPNPTCSSATNSAAPAGSPVQGCITPSTNTGTAAFGLPSGTNNTLYGPRQLQVSAKLFF